uniref:Disease resistance N-terminal domain-containing protein n=1 Tax=Aegilops tauschii subsp. strangulata TaxID=200361 RepID=A0A453D0U6_AEGTS
MPLNFHPLCSQKGITKTTRGFASAQEKEKACANTDFVHPKAQPGRLVLTDGGGRRRRTGMLNNTRRREIDNPALNVLLQKLRDLAYNAEDVLDELDYFRIQDQLEGTCEAADEHSRGCVCNLFFNAHHTARAVSKQLCSGRDPSEPTEEDATQRVFCCAWPCAKRRSALENTSSASHNHQAGDELVYLLSWSCTFF